MRTVSRKRRDGGAPAKPEALAEKMRAKGLRLTGQRQILAALLDEATEHLDAETVVALARRKDSTIHRATVYRTLRLLKRHGLIDELDLMHVHGERHFYEVHPGSLHIHLVCTRCKAIEEPTGPFWASVKPRLESDHGFRAEMIRIEVAGLCARCSRRKIRPIR